MSDLDLLNDGLAGEHFGIAADDYARQYPPLATATDIVSERGDEGVARIKEMTRGIGADAVLECVGTKQSMMQAVQSTRPGGGIGYVTRLPALFPT